MTAIATLPRITIAAGGRMLPDAALVALTAVRVRAELSLPTMCELTFGEPPGTLADVETISPGTALRVAVGDGETPLFDGEVTAVEYACGTAHERVLRVRGYDRLHRLRTRQPLRVHLQVTPHDLAAEFVADSGIAVAAGESGPLWQRLVQFRQTDWELLREVAERCGLYLALRGDTLHLVTLAGIGEPLPLVVGASLLEGSVEVNDAASCRSVRVAGWNPARVEVHGGTAASPRTGTGQTAGPGAEAAGKHGGERFFVDEATPDDRHADALAQAALDRRIAGEVVFTGVAEGDARLCPGTRIAVSGVAALAGEYALTAVTHTLDTRHGFVSALSTAPPPPPPRPAGSTTAIGVVTRVDDPETLGRVRVSLPIYGDMETDWLHVVSVGGGVGKGLMAVPDVGDTVLLLFAHADPDGGVVLGGLYGMGGMPESGVADGAVRGFTLRTRGGRRIHLDDARHLLRLEDGAGSFVELSPGCVRLYAATDIEIAALGKDVTIRGKHINFEEA